MYLRYILAYLITIHFTFAVNKDISNNKPSTTEAETTKKRQEEPGSKSQTEVQKKKNTDNQIPISKVKSNISKLFEPLTPVKEDKVSPKESKRANSNTKQVELLLPALKLSAYIAKDEQDIIIALSYESNIFYLKPKEKFQVQGKGRLWNFEVKDISPKRIELQETNFKKTLIIY